jgi:hypothetical protein
MISFQELIKLKTELFNSKKVKLVRHKDSRVEYREFIKNKASLIEYQKEQSKPVFKGVDYIIAFEGIEGTKAILFGFFKVGGVEIINNQYYYDLIELDICEDLIDRVVIDWGKATITWHQWFHTQIKEVVEVLPKGFIGDFPGLTNFILDFQELEKLFKNSSANRIWQNHLSSVNGVYMILDKKTGNHYIGSAYGVNGIWGRWEYYSKSKHCGNVELEKLCKISDDYHLNFQFTILQSLPSNMSPKEVFNIETLYKLKFGSRAFGLNKN